MLYGNVKYINNRFVLMAPRVSQSITAKFVLKFNEQKKEREKEKKES